MNAQPATGMRCYLHDEILETCRICEFEQDESGVWRDKDGFSLSDQFLRYAPYPVGIPTWRLSR